MSLPVGRMFLLCFFAKHAHTCIVSDVGISSSSSSSSYSAGESLTGLDQSIYFGPIRNVALSMELSNRIKLMRIQMDLFKSICNINGPLVEIDLFWMCNHSFNDVPIHWFWTDARTVALDNNLRWTMTPHEHCVLGAQSICHQSMKFVVESFPSVIPNPFECNHI